MAGGAFSGAKIYGIKLRESANDGSDFGTPDADYRFVFLGEDGRLYGKDATPTVKPVGSGAELDYTAITSDVTVTGTTEGGATTVVTSGSVTVDGATAIMIEFFSSNAQFIAATVTNGLTLDLYEDSTILGRISKLINTAISNTGGTSVSGRFRRTPGSGAHTYTVKAWKTAAGDTGIVKAGSGGTGAFVPAFIRVTRA